MDDPQVRIVQARDRVARTERKLAALVDGTWIDPHYLFEDHAASELASELLGLPADEVWRIARTWELCGDLLSQRTRLLRLEQGS